jgi:peptidoglycan/LPS O-acetylase OafA/YrhL
VAIGFVRPFPVLDHGLWSIVVETHFYLILPCLIAVSHRHARILLVILGSMIALRLVGAIMVGHAQDIAYWTIIGRIDQFLLGMFMFRCRDHMRGRHGAAALTALAFASFYYWFDAAGGWYGLGDQGAHGLIWALLPTIEGAAYALIIAYYDTSFTPSGKGLSGFIGKAGAYSYSIYLLHFFVVFRLAAYIDGHIMRLSNLYVACLWSAACFCLMVPLAALCFRWIEAPFLRMRCAYIRPLSGVHATGLSKPVTAA